MREIPAAFMATAVLILSLSSASADCELSCALGRLGAPCDSRGAVRTAPLPEPAQKNVASQSHCQHSAKSARLKLTIPPSSVRVSSHPGQACNAPAALTSLQVILKTAPLYSADPAGNGHLQPDNISTTARNKFNASLMPDLSALGPPLVSLRI